MKKINNISIIQKYNTWKQLKKVNAPRLNILFPKCQLFIHRTKVVFVNKPSK